MSFDYKQNTINVGQDDEDFTLDSAEFMLKVLFDIAKQPGASETAIKDAVVIKKWLDVNDAELIGDVKIKYRNGYRAYLATGFAPSFALQKIFDQYSSNPNSKEWLKHKPSTEVMDVFDRMNATDTEIKSKREFEFRKEKENLTKIFSKQKLNLFENLKSQISFGVINNIKLIEYFVLWIAFVIVRTEYEFELLGYWLERWDDDSYIANIALGPIVYFFGVKIKEKFSKQNLKEN